ncbi:MAG: histidinol-phosphatase HisJ family protein [Candidatus Thorarchaeota archaeon]
MIDYHIHPNYSLDAEGSIEDFCQAAISKGVTEIAFTTHLDTDPFTEDCIVNLGGKTIDVHSNLWFEDYEQNIRTMGDKYIERGLKVLLGAELDIYPSVLENLPESFHETEWDIVIGSVHLIDHLALSKKEDANIIYSKYEMNQLGEKYFSILMETIESSTIDVLGHLDLYRRYGEEYYGNEIHNIWRPYIDDLSALMKKHTTGFEINTSSWRRGLSEPMPSTPFVKALIDRGVTLVTVGSDAHSPSDVGSGIEMAIQLLRDCSETEPSRFRKRIPFQV